MEQMCTTVGSFDANGFSVADDGRVQSNVKSEADQSYQSQSGDTVGLKLLGDNTIHQQIITDEGLQQLKPIRCQQRSDGGITTADRPDQTQLGANYPNLFNPETWIPY